MSGWCALRFKLSNNAIRTVSINIDGKEVGTILADRFRQDLVQAQISDGFSAFKFSFNKVLDPFQAHTIRVYDSETGQELPSKCQVTK